MPDLIALLQVVALVDKWMLFLLGMAIGLWAGWTLSK